ncbi:MAG: hypothetical protein ABIG95_03825 [Candidatus Woesearchaeota archaeon]
MGDELEELKYNLKVSFSRMKQDIHFNKEQIQGLVELNKGLQQQILGLKEEIKGLKPSGLKGELVRQYRRNRKGLIKQRILGLIKEKEYSLPELKDLVVDEKHYCSKASFYRYIGELRKDGRISVAGVEGNESIIPIKNGND